MAKKKIRPITDPAYTSILLAEALEAHGFTVVHGHGVDGPTQGHVAADAFRHRVDASIDRDIVVARKG